jgi:hypothetical protein
MKMEQVEKIFSKDDGYRVKFSKKVLINDENYIITDFFPEMDEPPIEYEQVAWNKAQRFYIATGKIYTVEVTTGGLNSLINSNELTIEAITPFK